MSKRSIRKRRPRVIPLMKNERPCLNCGESGSHFIPPSFGDRGFYACDPKKVLQKKP